jgi:hypothetical protein
VKDEMATEGHEHVEEETTNRKPKQKLVRNSPEIRVRMEELAFRMQQSAIT